MSDDRLMELFDLLVEHLGSGLDASVNYQTRELTFYDARDNTAWHLAMFDE